MKTVGWAGFLVVAVAMSAGAQQERNSATQDISADQRAPKGMCRIWLRDVPAAQQPAATDCAAAVKNCPPNGRVIFGDTEESKTKPKTDLAETSYARKSAPMTKGLVEKKSDPPTNSPVLPRKPPL
jgi:hypothetical protein